MGKAGAGAEQAQADSGSDVGQDTRREGAAGAGRRR